MKLRIILLFLAIIIAGGAVFGVITYVNSMKFMFMPIFNSIPAFEARVKF